MKIGVIGAGSGIFSLNLIKDLCLTPRLHNSTVCFMDIDEERLNAAYTLCSRYAREVGMNLQISKTLDREECLRDADFVICTALVGGYKGWKDGWEIGKKWGFRWGGSLHLMHDEAFWINFYQFRMMEDVLLDTMRICPNAWLLMVSNPVLAGITYLKRKYPNAKLVGLCHGYSGVYNLAKRLNFDPAKMTYQIPGVNHVVWLNRFTYEGKDAFPLVDKWVKEQSEEYFKTCRFSDGTGPKIVDMYKRYGVFPIGDTGNPGGGAWGWFYHTDEQVEKQWNEDPDTWFKNYFEESNRNVALVKKAAYDETVKASDLVGTEASHEQIIPMIESIYCDIERVLIVNVLNDRLSVPGVPQDFEVEGPALVSARGIQPIATEPLPKPVIAYIYRDRIAPVEMELEAIRTQSRDLLVDLVMMDPFCHSRAQAEGLVEDILNLPYHTEMKEWYEGGK
jgi:alpha-galactosidase